MKTVEKPLTDVGIVVGRFQVHELHTGHIDLIQHICDKHSKVIVFLGLSPCMVTQNNPLDFESRKQMILEKFPNVIVLYIKDMKEDTQWSKELDEKISDIVGPNQSVTLYGSRDCFISHYSGKYTTQELVQDVFISGSEIRKTISKKVKNAPEFRAGVIWASANQYAQTIPTVDIAIFDESYERVLLGKKPKELEYRFIGGFASPNSESYEQDARREVQEETGLEVENLTYVGSFKVDDWRYKGEIDKIKTILFACKYVYGKPVAGDDIGEVRWFDLKNFDQKNIVDNHRKMWDSLMLFVKKIKS